MKSLYKTFLILMLSLLSCIFVKTQDILDDDDNDDNDYEYEVSAEEDDPDIVGLIIGILVGAFVLLVVVSVIMIVCCCIFNGTSFMAKRSRQPANQVQHYVIAQYPNAQAPAGNPNAAQTYPGHVGLGYMANPVEGQLPAYEAVEKGSAPPAYQQTVTDNEKNEVHVGYTNEAYGMTSDK